MVETNDAFGTDVLTYKEKNLDLKKLRGLPCDPEVSMTCVVYNQRTRAMRDQAFTRRNLVGKVCFYRTKTGMRLVGKILGFHVGTGHPVLYTKDQEPPDAENANIVILE